MEKPVSPHAEDDDGTALLPTPPACHPSIHMRECKGHPSTATQYLTKYLGKQTAYIVEMGLCQIENSRRPRIMSIKVGTTTDEVEVDAWLWFDSGSAAAWMVGWMACLWGSVSPLPYC